MLQVVQLTDAFESNNPNLKEAAHDKKRGYGIVTITYNGLVFGIPLRSNIKHKNGVILDKKVTNGKETKRGLDYSKAVLIRDQALEIGNIFTVPKEQKRVLISRENMIISQFEKYVTGYVKAVRFGIGNTLSSPSYRFTTLVNYHLELGLV